MDKKKFFLLVLAALTVGFSLSAQAEMNPVQKHRAGLPPFDVLQKILATNQKRQIIPPENTATSPTPYITWLADCDARVQPRFILSHPEGKIFSARNLTNQLNASLAAVDYGIRYLHSPVLLITGNTDNEPITLFLNGHLNGLDQTVRRELIQLYHPLQTISAEASANKTAERERKLTESNVDYQISLALERYADRVKTGRLVVIGSILDIANYYGKGNNQLIITNINGETDAKKMRAMPLLRTIDPKLLGNVGRPEEKRKEKEK